MKYFVRFSYDGSKFFGFQRLKNQVTVQEEIEKALSKIDQSNVNIKGAGRTDRGVHAKGQCAHFELVHNIPPTGLKSVLNKLLFPYISISECFVVKDDFHARFSVTQKTYCYRIYTGEFDPCLYDYTYECSKDFNLALMQKVANLFIGGHNFCNFVSGKRVSYAAIIDVIFFQEEGDYLNIYFIGKSFYRYMIRNLVGAMLDVGRGKRTLDEVKMALDDPDYIYSFSTVISNGLYLMDVKYKEF